MRICLVATEVFGLGIIGGFGKIVADLADELTSRGMEVCVVTWRRGDQRKVERLRGVPIYGAHRPSPELPFFLHLPSYAEFASLPRVCRADVYINIELKSLAWVAQMGARHSKHVTWFQDPYDEKAYMTMALVDPRVKWNFSRKMHFYATVSWLRTACRKADVLFTQARDFIPRIKRLYRPRKPIHFLPNPVEIPNRPLKKAFEPTVCFLGRWDPQKRVEYFFELSKKFPEIKFIAIGKSNLPRFGLELRRKYERFKNLEMPGFVSEDEKSRILERSWILINPSIREGLPLNFLEACAHKTAILSCVNPDRFASRFGYCVQDGDFESGLKEILKNDLWREKSELGYEYVSRVHAIDNVADRLLSMLVQ